MYKLATLTKAFLTQTDGVLAMNITEGHYPPIPVTFSIELEQAIDNMLNIEVRLF